MTLDDLNSFLANPNVAAFLHAIRLGEGTSDDSGYSRIVGGQTFDDFSHHPDIKVWLPRWNVWSTAAGAYQIINPTWVGLLAQYEFNDFSPGNQDLAAVALVSERGAIDDLIGCDLDTAIRKCSQVWASLPYSEAGQRIENYTLVLNEYTKYGGITTAQS